MAKGLIAAGWESYRERMVPPSAGKVQVSVTQEAFYGGAAILLAQLMLRLDPSADPTDEDLAMMDGIHAELVAFAKSKGG